LVLIVLCVAVLTTVNLGHNVSERIRLQNTADAAAYSMAALEARAFNFYAFANRTQVSHYVSAMVWQSYISFIYFTEAFLTDVYGVLKTLDVCAGNRSPFWAAACPVLEGLPYVGALIRVITTVIDVYRSILKLFQLTLRQLNPDFLIGRVVIPAHRQLNQGLAWTANAMMAWTLAEVARGGSEIITANDKNLRAALSPGVVTTINACLFDRAHFREAGGSPFAPKNPLRPISPRAIREKSKESRAKRVMGGIANATRYACDSAGSHCPQGLVTARDLDLLLPLPDLLRPVRDFMRFFIKKQGQTRLLSYDMAKGFEDREGGNLIRHWRDPPDSPQGMMAQGDNLGADDLYSIKLGPSRVGPFKNPLACGDGDEYWKCWGDPREGKGSDRSLPYRYMLKTSVWAMNHEERRGSKGGVHWRVAYRGWPRGKGHRDPEGSEAELGLNESKYCPLPTCPHGAGQISVFVANVRPIEDGNHPWEGIVPFMHFEPGEFADDCPSPTRPSVEKGASRRREFNQPSTWAILNKTPRELRNRVADPRAGSNVPALLNEEGRLQLDLFGPSSLEMDNSRKVAFGLASSTGLNAISRAQVYYHRPGNWAEQPNFFNPYWRPRLASVSQGAESLPLLKQLMQAHPERLQGSPHKLFTH
jgi:hypothetical protein